MLGKKEHHFLSPPLQLPKGWEQHSAGRVRGKEKGPSERTRLSGASLANTINSHQITGAWTGLSVSLSRSWSIAAALHRSSVR